MVAAQVKVAVYPEHRIAAAQQVQRLTLCCEQHLSKRQQNLLTVGTNLAGAKFSTLHRSMFYMQHTTSSKASWLPSRPLAPGTPAASGAPCSRLQRSPNARAGRAASAPAPAYHPRPPAHAATSATVSQSSTSLTDVHARRVVACCLTVYLPRHMMGCAKRNQGWSEAERS